MSLLYPVFLDLAGKPCLVVGAGAVALRKISSLLESSARVFVVAPSAAEEVRSLAESGSIEFAERRFEPGDADGVALVIAATSDEAVNRAVSDACRSRGIFCNVVDVPCLCDFHVPAVVRRGDLTVAVSTGGKGPAFAGLVREEIEKILTERHGAALEAVASLRDRLRSREDLDQRQRGAILRKAVRSEALADFLAGRTGELDLEAHE